MISENGDVRNGSSEVVGFSADEIDTGQPTFAARLRWSVVVDEALPAGQQVNAAVCVSAVVSAAAANLLARGGPDAGGSEHLGLPWAGCSVYAADSSRLRRLRRAAAGLEGVLVADMPRAAQLTRVYDEYLAELLATEPESIDYAAVSVLGPRKAIGKLVGSLQLL